jgi:hypothetical protein
MINLPFKKDILKLSFTPQVHPGIKAQLNSLFKYIPWIKPHVDSLKKNITSYWIKSSFGADLFKKLLFPGKENVFHQRIKVFTKS